MIYDLSNIEDKIRFKTKVSTFISKGSNVELKEQNKQRTLTQNNSIHLYCKMIAEVFNDFGITHKFKGVASGKDLEVRFTMTLVKEVIWRPIQMSLFGKKSTTKLTTKEVSEIAQPLEKFIAENFAIDLPFPSKENKENNDNNSNRKN